MTRHLFVSDKNSWAILGPAFIAGRRMWCASHAMLGIRADFYVFTRAAGASTWIKGQPEHHDALKRLHTTLQLDAFAALVEKILWEHPQPR